METRTANNTFVNYVVLVITLVKVFQFYDVFRLKTFKYAFAFLSQMSTGILFCLLAGGICS